MAVKKLPGDCHAEVIDDAALRKILPVALAERYISQAQNVYAKSRLEIITELVRYVENGLFLKCMVVLCNA